MRELVAPGWIDHDPASGDRVLHGSLAASRKRTVLPRTNTIEHASADREG
jgi:hypothetical protein